MIDFPTAPIAGQAHTLGRIVWTFDGVKWLAGPQAYGAAEAALPAILTVTGTTTLPTGYVGFCGVENASAAPMTVFLPLTPTAGQQIEVKDSAGNASLYPITVNGNYAQIEGAGTLVIAYNFGWVDLIYTGSMWVQS